MSETQEIHNFLLHHLDIPAGLPHSHETLGDEPFVFLCSVPNLPNEVEILG